MSQRALVGSFILSLLILAAGTASPAEAQVESERIATGLNRPVFGTAPAGDPDRLFVLEKPGRIRIIENGVLLATPFLNIVGEVNDGGNEQGLLGLAFHPDYASNGHFFVYHNTGSGSGSTAVRRYTALGDPMTSNVADANSKYEILIVNQPQSNHNGGTVAFGPNDGYLYLGFGDGGGANDSQDRAQNPQEYMGKLIRIDVDNDGFPGDATKNYAIPPDNPWISGVDGVLDEIWSRGWRNPYRFSFDSETGDAYTADVGQNCWEEIDFQPASSTGRENWGWNLMEGLHCFNKNDPFNCFAAGCNPLLYVLPIHEYRHQSGRCSITGGFVYRGQDIPWMDGSYFFADYCSREVWTFRYDGSTMTDFTERTDELDPPVGAIGNITGFGQDGRGELYIFDENGQVFKILPGTPNGVVTNPVREMHFAMTGGAPNPFVTTTFFQVRLDSPAALEVNVYDAAGRHVRTLQNDPNIEGVVPVSWDGRGSDDLPVPAGVYFVRAVSAGQTVTKRVTLLR